jgi:hypothetical protein|uniref:Uncharacterized protein n=1 Tax=viral metagenome TaxID=1070528 RepID=A0A6C0CLD8_9ZZZZ
MAAYTKDFTFDQLSRIGDDSCSLSQSNIQNAGSANYLLTNYFVQDCGLKRPIDFGTSQPGIFVSAPGTQVGLGGCNVDANSELLIGTINTNPKCRISLYERPFKTVPFLGRGPSNPVLESHIQQGDMIQNKKSINTTTEQSYIPYKNYPLLPSIENSISNPANLVEGVAADGWIRGGVPSRELQKDKDYKNAHTMYQY